MLQLLAMAIAFVPAGVVTYIRWGWCYGADTIYSKLSAVTVFGAEYEAHYTPLDHSHDCNVPCAMYQASGHTSKMMIPSYFKCPPGWNTEYYSYLMAGHHGFKSAIQFTCMDRSLE